MAKYKFLKDSKLERPRSVPYEDYISASYGTEYSYEPSDTPVRVYHYSGSGLLHTDARLLYSLKNTINYYKSKHELYDFNNFYNKECNMLAFSSYHLGSGFVPGTVALSIYDSGSLIARATDTKEDGILYDDEDNSIGIILYREGFILVNNTSSINPSKIYQFYDNYNDPFLDNMKWTHFNIGSEESVLFDMEYSVQNTVSVNTFFIPLEKQDLNYSNDSTYIQSGSYKPIYGRTFFKENEDIVIKNTSKSPFVSGSANYEKQTFITKIGLYDENKKLIAVGNLANPIRKTENREYMLKLRLDI